MLFHDVAQTYLNQYKEELAPLTVRTYFWNLKKIKDFRPNLECNDVNDSFVKEYRAHLRQMGNKPNTVIKGLSVLRSFSRKMMQDGFIEKNPFEKVRIGEAYTQRGFLSISELKKLYLNFLENGGILNESEYNTMQAFLFSCFTGLRYSDLRSLDASEIIDWKIRKQTHKTGAPVYIPIPQQARLLLPRDLKAGKVFKIMENSSFNRVLRTAAPKLGYFKHIHCHLARHTFATTCISLGISLPATSKLLGHRKLETTLIYAKFVDTFLNKEMKKFNKMTLK